MAAQNAPSVIVSDPEILGGMPCFGDTRVPFANLLSHLKHGGSIDDFLIGFPTVTRDQVNAALDYMIELVQRRSAT